MSLGIFVDWFGTDPENTPKNTLIKAIREKNTSQKTLLERQEKYEKILDFLLGKEAESYLQEIK